MKRNLKKFLVIVSIFTLCIGIGAVCYADGDSGGVAAAIESASNSVKSDATKVIVSAVGLGSVFWGAKVLWGKFKSMAK